MIQSFLRDLGVPHGIMHYCVFITRLFILLPIIYLFFRISKSYSNRIIRFFSRKTKSDLVQCLIEKRAGDRFYFFLLIVLVYNFGIEPLCADISYLVKPVSRIFLSYVTVLFTRFLIAGIRGLEFYAQKKPKYKDRPMKGFAHVGIIVVYIVGGIYAIAAIFDQDPVKVFGFLGGASVVLVFAFKDIILGFVASIQLVYFDMVHIGDWITLDNYGADGDVVEINLASVKVRNFDQTFTTIPTYALISGSFKNWQGMIQSGGRRIKRSILINKNSIRFCTPHMLDQFQKIALITTYIKETRQTLEKEQHTSEKKKDFKINGVHMTNLGCYRVYIEKYLASLPVINTKMEYVVRYLDANEKGLPVEIYAFTKEKSFRNYEVVVANIFDHLYASTVYFDLDIVQSVTAQDIKIKDL